MMDENCKASIYELMFDYCADYCKYADNCEAHKCVGLSTIRDKKLYWEELENKSCYNCLHCNMCSVKGAFNLVFVDNSEMLRKELDEDMFRCLARSCREYKDDTR